MIDFFESDKLDAFFIEITNIFIYALENGLAFIHKYPIEIEDKHTLSTVKVGLDCVQDGLEPLVIKTILETSNLIAFKDEMISKQAFFEMKLLEIIIPYIQCSEIKKYLNLMNRLCSRNICSKIEACLLKHIADDSKDIWA